MRTRILMAVATLAAVAVGGSRGDDPKPAGRLVLSFREEVRYLSPAGQDLQRIDYRLARKAAPGLTTGTLTIGTDGVKTERFLPHCGRVGPGGVIPLAADGMKLLTPGDPPTATRVAANEYMVPVVAWEADSRHVVLRTTEEGVWGTTKHLAYRTDVATGVNVPLPFGPEHEVVDTSADGRLYLTYRHAPRSFGLPGFSDDGTDVSLVTREGKVLHAHPLGRAATRQETAHRLSPDGSRSAACYKARAKEGDKWGRSALVIYDYPAEGVKATTVAVDVARPADVECLGVAWSPDGKRIVSCWRLEGWKDRQTWHVVVCDADGRNVRTVSTFEMKADEQIRSVDWR